MQNTLIKASSDAAEGKGKAEWKLEERAEVKERKDEQGNSKD